MMMVRRKGLRSETVGERPHRLRIFERRLGGTIYCQYWDRETQRQTRINLGHRNWEQARLWAQREAGLLSDGLAKSLKRDAVTVDAVLSAYLETRTPSKVASEQQGDQRRAALFRTLWRSRLVRSLGERDWRDFIRIRTAGGLRITRVKPDGTPTVTTLGPVRARTVDADLVFINAVFNWACQTMVDGRPLIDRNPFGNPVPGSKRWLERPKEMEPQRPVVVEEWCEKVRDAAAKVRARVGGAYRETPLPTMIEVAHGTARRITAVCRLRTTDLEWGERDGQRTVTAVRWSPIKGAQAVVVPVNVEVGAALAAYVRTSGLIGDRWLFPAPKDGSRHVSKRVATEWLYRAIEAAKVEKPAGGAWHMFRRKWATERKHWPWQDIARAGGWKDRRALESSYITWDDTTVSAVVNEPKRLRGAK
jgi:hypothetical protein